MYRSIQLFIIILLFATITNQKKTYAQVDVEDQQSAESFPLSLQLYPRNLATNESIVPISGVVDNTVYKQVKIEVLREDMLWFESTQSVEESSTYDYQVSIQAELADYTFNLYGLTHSDEQVLLKTAERVVSGDAFLINGQSNAIGTGASNEPSQKMDRHPFSRTFGSSVLDETVSDYPYWYETRTRISNDTGSTSVWGGRLCFMIIETVGIPCATVNGAYPGVATDFFLPNDEDRFDLTTVYGRLLWRSRESGLQNAYRAIFWYQGENDGVDANAHKENMELLFDYWREDFPSLEHHFIMQIRYGCGTIEYDNRVFEVQRQFKNRANTTIVPTNGIPWYDGCHYHAPGYEILADQLFYPVTENMYGAYRRANATPPDILSAKQNDLKTVTLTLDMPEGDELTVEEGFHIDFTIIRDNGNALKPIDGVVAGNVVTLTLRKETFLFDANIGYVGGKEFVDLGLDSELTPRIMNLNGIHLLNFWDEPIESLFLPTRINLQSTMTINGSLLLINLMVSGLLLYSTGHVIYSRKFFANRRQSLKKTDG